MTIQFNRNSQTFVLSTGNQSKSVPVSALVALAASQSWGDIQTLIETCKQNPDCIFPVENVARVVRARNSRMHGILQ